MGNCIATWGSLGEVYRNRGWLGWGKLCHNTRNCILTSRLLVGLVSRYNCWYCDRRGWQLRDFVSQYTSCIVTKMEQKAGDVSRPRPRHGHAGRAASLRHGHQPCDTARGQGHDTAGACPRYDHTRAAWAMCAHYAFDPIFGLNIVSESLFGHCS